ncbi:MAG: carbonic anhydrase [Candidatus Paracaedibacteraceae bacterium]|nr:carbonic anhydrase [Candidatus Paracaedibacteraceae bacterium]
MYFIKKVILLVPISLIAIGCSSLDKTNNATPTPQKPAHSSDTQPQEQLKEMVKEMLHDNQKFVSSHQESYFDVFKNKETPRATVVACADSRFHTHSIDQTPDNDIFFVRNIGNQLATAEGSIEYGVEHLKTPLLMFIGHTACGAVKAASSDFSTLSEPIKSELHHLQLVKKKQVSDDELHANVIQNVHNQVAKAMVKFKDKVKSGEVKIIGAVYDFKNAFGKGHGKLVLVNVNNEKSEDSIKAFKEYILKK